MRTTPRIRALAMQSGLGLSILALLACGLSYFVSMSYWRGRVFLALGMGSFHFHATHDRPPKLFGGFQIQMQPVRFQNALVFKLSSNAIDISSWIPVALLALPTAYLWHRDRRRPAPDHCKHCNYNLTGNQSGTCPECGHHAPMSEPEAPAPDKLTSHARQRAENPK